MPDPLNASLKASPLKIPDGEHYTRRDYTYPVGKIGEDYVRRVLEELTGFAPIPHKTRENGVDIYIPKIGLKAEVINWDDRSYMDDKRARSINDNLKGAKIKVLIILSPTPPKLPDILYKSILILWIPFQVLPSFIYNLTPKENRSNRLRESESTFSRVKNLILSFLSGIGLGSLMYILHLRIRNIGLTGKTSKGREELGLIGLKDKDNSNRGKDPAKYGELGKGRTPVSWSKFLRKTRLGLFLVLRKKGRRLLDLGYTWTMASFQVFPGIPIPQTNPIRVIREWISMRLYRKTKIIVPYPSQPRKGRGRSRNHRTNRLLLWTGMNRNGL